MGKINSDEKKKFLKAWAEADYSWEGLADKPWVGWSINGNGDLVESRVSDSRVRDATMQDYWRDQEGELIEFGGKKWTPIHLPLSDTYDAERKQKLYGDRIWNSIKSRFAISTKTQDRIRQAETDAQGWFPIDSDNRLQLQGAVLPPCPSSVHLPQLGRWHIFARHARFLGRHDFSGREFGDSTDFSGALFDEDANFFEAIFGAQTIFAGALFSQGANFWRATFCGMVSFENAVFLGERSSFWVAEFIGEVRFLSSSFESKKNWFRYTKFGGRAYFSRSERDTSGARFLQEVDFYGAIFNDSVSFRQAEFRSKLSFQNVVFRGAAEFYDCQFPDAERDWRCAFHGAVANGIFDFRSNDNQNFHTISMFGDARLEKNFLFPRLHEKNAMSIFKQRSLRLALAETGGSREDALTALERGAITLRGALSQNNDGNEANKFYCFELITRRHLKRTSTSEKFALIIYYGFSRFGYTIWLPLIADVLLSCIFSASYLLISNISSGRCIFGYDSVSVKSVMQLSFNNTFRPFWFWGLDTTQSLIPGWLISIFPTIGSDLKIWGIVAFLSSFQSLFSIICLFLLGFCLKRRFQLC